MITANIVRLLVVMPISAVFILFDFIVHNPLHPETKQNLSLLGAASGYFCRLEYTSDGKIQSRDVTVLVDIATQYIRDVESTGSRSLSVQEELLDSQTPSASGIDLHMGNSQSVSSVSLLNPCQI